MTPDQIRHELNWNDAVRLERLGERDRAQRRYVKACKQVDRLRAKLGAVEPENPFVLRYCADCAAPVAGTIFTGAEGSDLCQACYERRPA